MDFVRGGKKAWGVSGSCRHLAPAKQSLALGSSQILPAVSPDLRREVGVVLRMKTGVLVRRCPRLLHNANRCVFPARSALTCRRFVSVFLLCAG